MPNDINRNDTEGSKSIDPSSDSGATHSSGRQLDLTDEQIRKLERAQLLADVQTDLLAWGKKRFWTIAFITVFLGVIGTRALVRDLFHDDLREGMKASAKAEAATEAARAAANSAAGQLKQYGHTIGQLQEQAKALGEGLTGLKSVVELQARLEAKNENVRAETRLSFESLQRQLSELAYIVQSLSQSLEHQGNIADIDMRLKMAKAHAKHERAEFIENSTYSVEVVLGSGGPSNAVVIDVLRQQGFQTSFVATKTLGEAAKDWGILISELQKEPASAKIVHGPDTVDKAKNIQLILI